MINIIFVNAEQTVGNYQNSFFNKSYDIEASAKNERLESVFIGVEAKDSRSAFIEVGGKNLESFRTALELVRDKYADWVKIAKESNVTEMRKEFGIYFPSVSVCWSGSEWWFSFGNSINMKFLILESGKMVASWSPTVTSSSNRYIDETIYFVFNSVEDFNNLISQLDYNKILSKLLKTKNDESLFN